MQARDRSRRVAGRPGATGPRRAEPLRVAIIGAGRARHGTGPYVALRLIEGGADVVAVATTAPESAGAAAEAVSTRSGRPCRAFASAAELLATTAVDAVAICSPASAHAEHLRLALGHRLDVFCEKPLVEAVGGGDLAGASEIIAGFAAKGLVLHVNTQWVYVLEHLKALYQLDCMPELRQLRVELEPPVRGAAMVPEAVPHANSLLLSLAPGGTAGALRASLSPAGDELDISFTWQATSAGGTPAAPPADVAYRLRWRSEQPRRAAFEVNGMPVERTVDMGRGYEISFTGNGRTVVADPLAGSVEAFLEAVRSRPLPDGAILPNLDLMAAIAGSLELAPATSPGSPGVGIARMAG